MFALACSRLSDSGEDTKVKGTRKVYEAKKRKRKGERACSHQFPPVLFSFSRFLSRSLEQAMFSVRPRTQTYFRSSLLSTRKNRRPEIRLRSQASRDRDSTACKTSDISFSARFAGLLKAGPTESFLYE